MFHGISVKLQPGLGVLPPAWSKTTFLDTAVRRSCSIEVLNAFSLQYGEPVGDMGRRRALLRRSDGPNLEVMARYCEVHQPKLFVSVSVFHNPTGFCLQPRSAYRVLQLANQHNVHIVEDDTYSHFAPEHATRLCALDNLQRTIYVGGFTKILAPNWRVGYLVASPKLAEVCWTPNCCPHSPHRPYRKRPWLGALSKANCAAMQSASALNWTPPATAAGSWRWSQALCSMLSASPAA